MLAKLLLPKKMIVWCIMLIMYLVGGVSNRSEIIVGDIRVQALMPHLIRVEKRGPNGFEDQPTFLTVNRSWPGVQLGPAYNISPGVFNISSSSLNFSLQITKGPSKPKTCWAEKNVYVFSPQSTQTYKHGLYVDSVDKCCKVCDADINCTAWKYNEVEYITNNDISTGNSTCANILSDTDVSNPILSKSHNISQLCNLTLLQCCTTCDADSNCVAFVHTPPSKWAKCLNLPYCFLLSGFSATFHSSNHTFGLKKTLSPTPPPTPSMSTCTNMQSDTDVTNPVLSKSHNTSELCNMTLLQCCSTCDSDPTCKAFVRTPPSTWAKCPNLPYCFLLSDFSTIQHKTDHVFGLKGGPLPTPAPTPKPNCFPLLHYRTLQKWAGPNSIFGCPRRGCGTQSLSFHVSVYDSRGASILGTSAYASSPFRFPDPGDVPKVFGLRDWPRFIVPVWGATPAPENVTPPLRNSSGYDNHNAADDIYLFIGLDNDYDQLRRIFLALTGPIPQLPDWAFGTWFTWWHPYTQAEAMQEIKQWKEEKLPLDIWGLDMNWRDNGWSGGSTGASHERFYNYTNTTLFPNMTSFIEFEHQIGTHIYFNDHPSPVGPQTSPQEIQFRFDGLTLHLTKGLDFWWMDPNWHISIPGAFGLDNRIWGAHVYESIQKYFYHNRSSYRPIMLGMVDSSHAAHHRYPVWWTGDGKSLAYSLKSMINYGIYHLKPYVHSDCGGGNSHSQPSDDEFLRWTQHCALAPVFRYHGGAKHQPWVYGNETEAVVRNFINMRYKLLPTFIACGQRASVDGMPIVRRLDLIWPTEQNASRSDQYLLGDDLLVAPIVNGGNFREVWIPPGEWQDAWMGDVVTGPKTIRVNQPSNRMPLWHRRGGLVVTAPVALFVNAQNWTTLTLEIFPQGKGNHSVHRTVGRQNEENQSFILFEEIDYTKLKLMIDGDKRQWLIRFHLLPGQKLIAVTMNQKSIPVVHISPIQFIKAHQFFPFGGGGTASSPQAGFVAELRINCESYSTFLEANLINF